MTSQHPHYTYQFGGSLPSDAPSYVMRQADHDLFDALRKGTYCYVLNSRQMGKSSLRVRTVDRLWDAGVICVEIELLGIGSQQITAAQWYGGIIQVLIVSLELKINRRQWMQAHEDLSPVQRLGSFIDQVVLPQTKQPLVLCFDEIDSVLGLNFPTDDFFGLIRNWYEKRATDPAYKRLTVVMLGVATPSDLIQDPRSTPFNIGKAIELRGFTIAEAHPLLPGLTPISSAPQAVLEAILTWTGGQPFLTQKLCQLVVQHAPEACSPNQVNRNDGLAKRNPSYDSATVSPASPASPAPPASPASPASAQHLVDTIVHSHLLNHWESKDEPEHLRTIRDRLLRTSQTPQRLLRLYHQILKRGWSPLVNTPDQMELRLTGLVTRHQSTLQVFNQVYQTVFDRTWVTEQLNALEFKTVHPPSTPAWMPVLIGMGTAAVVIGLRSLGLWQSLELKAFDQLMQWRSPEPADDRFLVLTISEADIQYQDQQGMTRTGSLSDQALLQVLQKLNPHQPRIIGLDIYHDFPFASPELAAEMEGGDRLFTVCEVGQTVDIGTDVGVDQDASVSIAAPPGIPTHRIGFTDFPTDSDYVVRRQLLGMSKTEECPTSQSLGLRLALHYLEPTGVTLQRLNRNQFKLGSKLLPKLPFNGGGYQLPTTEGGYQLLVNYRHQSPQSMALRELLQGRWDEQLSTLVRDRIILIGVADPKDAHFTSIQSGRMIGVMVHAHMASQLISAVEENRPLLWWLPEGLEMAWIGSWPTIASVLLWGWRTRYQGRIKVVALIVGGGWVLLWSSSYIVLLIGGWLPVVPGAIALITASSIAILYPLSLR